MLETNVAPRQWKRFDTFGVVEMAHIDPAQNRRRYYCISLQPGLFDVSLQRLWGRLGRKPRVKNEFCESLDDALSKANRLYRQKPGKVTGKLESRGVCSWTRRCKTRVKSGNRCLNPESHAF